MPLLLLSDSPKSMIPTSLSTLIGSAVHESAAISPAGPIIAEEARSGKSANGQFPPVGERNTVEMGLNRPPFRVR